MSTSHAKYCIKPYFIKIKAPNNPPIMPTTTVSINCKTGKNSPAIFRTYIITTLMSYEHINFRIQENADRHHIWTWSLHWKPKEGPPPQIYLIMTSFEKQGPSSYPLYRCTRTRKRFYNNQKKSICLFHQILNPTSFFPALTVDIIVLIEEPLETEPS